MTQFHRMIRHVFGSRDAGAELEWQVLPEQIQKALAATKAGVGCFWVRCDWYGHIRS